MQGILAKELSFFFLNRICNCLYVHHLSLWLLVGPTDPVLSCTVICLYSVHFNFSCTYKGFIPCGFIILVVIHKTAPKCLWQCRGICCECKTFVMCDFWGGDFFNIGCPFRIVQPLESTEHGNVKMCSVMIEDRNFGNAPTQQPSPGLVSSAKTWARLRPETFCIDGQTIWLSCCFSVKREVYECVCLFHV